MIPYSLGVPVSGRMVKQPGSWAPPNFLTQALESEGPELADRPGREPPKTAAGADGSGPGKSQTHPGLGPVSGKPAARRKEEEYGPD